MREIQGELVEGWTISDDGLVYTFNLRQDVTWHDGEQFTASALGGFETTLRELGVIETNTMATPMTPLNDEEAARVRGVLHETGML